MKNISLYLAHGAGVGHTSVFLEALNASISEQRGSKVIPVTFSYMKEQERLSKKRPPLPFKSLVSEFACVIKDEKACIVAGKSMGGRVATQLSNLSMVKAIVCFGFPFHPVGKPEKHRLSFLEDLQVPCLIIQGTRDKMGGYDWVRDQTLPSHVDIVWVQGADHDFKVLKKENKSFSETILELTEITQKWLHRAV